MRITKSTVGVALAAAVAWAAWAFVYSFPKPSNTLRSIKSSDSIVEDTHALPEAARAELGLIGQLYSAVAREAMEREPQWRTRLAVAAPAAATEVREQLRRAMKMLAALEAIPPIDTSSFAVRPPSRIWNASGRLDARGKASRLPPSPGLEMRTGPEATVVAHSGEFCLDEEELVLPARGGMGFSFCRYYRALSEYDGPLGYGWDHNHNIRLIADAGSITEANCLTLHTGAATVHFQRAGQNWVTQRGGFLELEVNERGIVAVTDSVRNHMLFEPAASAPKGRASWRLQRKYTRHGQDAGNQLAYRYAGGTDVLASVEDPFGRTIRFHYDSTGRLRVVLVPGSRIELTYDEHGRLSSASIPQVASSLKARVSSTIHYGYQEADGRHWCTSKWQHGSPSQLFIDYDLQREGQAYGAVRAAGYEQRGQPVERIAWEFEWHTDGDFRAVTMTRPTPGARETFVFDAHSDMPWLLTSRSIPTRNATWAFKYNADGLCIEETHPDGFVTRRLFDVNNNDARCRANCLDEAVVAAAENVIGPLRSKGVAREFLRGTSLPLRISAYEIDATGTRSVLKDERCEYDPKTFDLIRASVGDEPSWYFWNKRGQLIGEVDGCGAVTLHSYLGGVPEQNMHTFVDGAPAGGGVLVKTIRDVPQADLVAQLSGDDHDRARRLPARTASLPPAPEISQFLYDHLGRKIGQKGPGTFALAVFNRAGQQLASWTSATGLVVTEYDNLLRRQRVLRELALPAHDDRSGRFSGSGVEPFDGKFFAESYEYDTWGHVKTFSPTDEPTQEGANRPEFRYERHLSGALRRLIDPVGTSRVHEYDANTGLPSRITLEGPDGEALTLKKFLSYSPSGLLLKFQDDCGDVWTTRQDSLGRAFEEARPDGVISRTSLDGMDRPTRNIQTRDEDVVDEQAWEYSPSGRITRILRSRLRKSDRDTFVAIGKVIVEENYYDLAGRLTKQRGPRPDAWKRVFYDGTGRVVGEQSPEGDWRLAIYRDGLPVVRSTLMRQSVTDTFVALREATLLTERFQPYVVIPIDSGGIAQWGRARFQQWSSQGLLLETLEPEGLHSQLAYDTRGNRVYEAVAPSRPSDSGEQQQRVWQYDAAGRLVSQILTATPLALFRNESTGDVVTPRRVPVPQAGIWRYDSLGRLTRHDQPDGLQVLRQYGRGGSMVARMTWRHATKPDQSLRDIEFRYGPLRRLAAVLQVGEKDPIQEFQYDAWGHCMRSDDATGHERVVVQREFDNLGHQWRERVSYGDLAVQDLVTEDNIATGTRRLRWQHPNAMLPTFWTEASYLSDRDGRVTSLLLDGKDFCHWAYEGQMPTARTIPSSQTRRSLSLNAMGEVVGVKIEAQRGGTWSSISDMRYGLDTRGSVTSSVIRLDGGNDRPESVVSQYTELDAYRQIIGSSHEPVAWPDPEARRHDLFSTANSPAAVLVSRTYRDQTGNTYARHQGRWSDLPLETALERGTLFSPAQSFGPLDDKGAEATQVASLLKDNDKLQLASNRLTAAAYQGHEQPPYQYDPLGQLAEYAGTYWDGEKSQPVFWSLTFDGLGRLIRMRAVARDPDKAKPSHSAAAVADVDYAYDAGGRRIVKRVTDHGTNRVRREAALYCDDRQTVILEQHGDGSWVQKQQYVWGPSPAEVLQVVTSPSDAGTGSSPQLERYALHQDRGMDVVFATSVVAGHVTATPLATYLDTGENASMARVSEIRASMPMTKPEASRNGRVDDGERTHFSCDAEWNWIEIRMTEAKKVTGLTIWTDEFPNNFEVYRVAPEQRLPAADEIEEWTQRAKTDGRLVASARDGLFVSPSGIRRKLSLMECPYDIAINGIRTERLVVLWRDRARQDRSVSVAEISINVMPEAVSSLGQNGAWLDRETGLYYQLHRYRLPAMNGKFISPDPLGFLSGPDLYAYANNNPLHWHDPDGRFAHILWGAGIGAAFGGGAYLVDCWISGEEISWKKLAIRTAAGAATGAVTALTFGAVSGFLAAHSYSAVANALITGASTGGVAGFTGGFLPTSAEGILIDGRTPGEALMMGLAAGGRGAVIGAVGGGAGGAVLSQTGASLLGTALSGASGGAAGGGVAGAWRGYDRHGLSTEMLRSAGIGALQGAVYGAAGAAGGWAAGRASGLIRPMTDYPEELPRPGGLLVRTKPGERTYGDIPAEPGYARHHVKPLSLGGRDVASNIEHVPLQQHRIPHPPQSVRNAPLGTIFY